MWVIGLITSFLTATYMFRLVFLTFHGERRHDAPSAGQAGHGHGSHLHDAPPAMALALIVLAIGSVLAGLVGIPHALGGHNRLEAFLHPAFEAHAVAPINEFQVVQPGQPPAPAETASAGHDAAAEESTERMLMALSTGIALTGIGLAWFFWIRNRKAAATVARSATPIYTLLLNKYYVDEIYNAVIVQPIKHLSTLVLWKAADAGLIDGTVNGVGSAVRGSSMSLRRLQSGSIRAYAGSLFFGVVLILGWYLLR
jgi:NADH-quinone oxidoreductase subunit L